MLEEDTEEAQKVWQERIPDREILQESYRIGEV